MIAIALFTVNFSHLYYNVIQRGCEAISDQNYKIARNCFTYMLDFIVMQMSKVNREKDYLIFHEGFGTNAISKMASKRETFRSNAFTF